MNDQQLEALKLMLDAQNALLIGIAARVEVADSTFDLFQQLSDEAREKWFDDGR